VDIPRTVALRLFVVPLLLLAGVGPARGQFSPGPLSSAHAALEGSTNCTKCHDVGREIAGPKCLECHSEIRSAIDRKTGYHAVTAARQACVDCHKDHLGREAATYRFDPEKFDHDLTGFSLAGKHGTVRCSECHTGKFLKDSRVREIASTHSRQTYLGLGIRCADCHADVHKGRFGPECSTCHNPAGWRDVRSFDHSRTKFTLAGKHAAVACEKCHKSAAEDPGGKKFSPIAAAAYEDCTPCHATPHRPGAVKGTCSSCHDATGWALAMEKPFDHALTKYPLAGAHARVRCAACHQAGEGKTYPVVFRRSFARCTDCHADRHDGAFVKAYANDCARCHTIQAYSPSSFSLDEHQKSSWPLAGAHRAVLCADCHRKGPATAPWVFRMKTTRCEACHEDPHKGQFAAQMREGGCASCHSADGWKKTAFAHGTLTSFPLEGKHAAATCESCHKEVAGRSAGARHFAKLAAACESCHKDEHRAQFAAGGATDCARCHSAVGWKPVNFDHETKSAFHLSGAHAKVRCESCHRRETVTGLTTAAGDRAGATTDDATTGGATTSGPTTSGPTFTRYKPLSSSCESCHQTGERR